MPSISPPPLPVDFALQPTVVMIERVAQGEEGIAIWQRITDSIKDFNLRSVDLPQQVESASIFKHVPIKIIGVCSVKFGSMVRMKPRSFPVEADTDE